MATLALSAAGSLAGGALLPGLSLLGGSITGAVVGRAIGALAGSRIDQALLGAQPVGAGEGGPRLADLSVTASTEGAPIPRLYGRARLGGQLIWADRIEEAQVSGGGGKGGGRPSSGGAAAYAYYASFAVAICEGPIARIGRVWADGRDFDLSRCVRRIHHGTETQRPDSLIAARLGGDGNAPAYRGIAYVVFERLPLGPFGNRIPQFNFEAFRAVDPFEGLARAVTLIPAAGEFCYETTEVLRDRGGGRWASENRHGPGGVDIVAALDALQQELPNVQAVSLFVAWFGDDLRAEACTLAPRVESRDKVTAPLAWAVGGLDRGGAGVVSRSGGAPAYGGTPSDHAVASAVAAMKGRGLAVAFTPLILMDIPAGNALPDPWREGTPPGQPAYPWRGRITVSPAPGVAGSPDRTPAAAAQIAAFVARYRAFLLHYAGLCAAVGGVDAFVIGSELRGLTWVRSGAAGPFPFVEALVALAAEVKAILPGAKIVYAADWSEFTPFQTVRFGGPPGELFFHLDPLWASPHVDAVGIDVYWPLADWRDGASHLDRRAGWRRMDDLEYLKSNMEGGEGYGWYYADQGARDSQRRTPIADALGKPWAYRYKDIRAWWANRHHDRPEGVERGAPTAWRPESKPLWFMELGCPAVDRGANQPNVFHDPKSAESGLPPYSSGRRDDVIQRRHLRAVLDYFADPAHNPTSGAYGGPMLDLGRVFLYTWDARPWPAFPGLSGLWADGPNWSTGHWLNGRMGEAPLAETVAAILDGAGFSDYDVGQLSGAMQGYVIDRIMSPRQAIEPLAAAFFFDAFESEGVIRFRHRGREEPLFTLTPDDLVDAGAAGREAALYQLTRGQETELPRAAKVTFVNGDNEYAQGVAEARRAAAAMGSRRESQAQLPIVWSHAEAGRVAATLLHEAWASRERGSFRLPPARLALEPGDVIALRTGGAEHLLRVTELGLSDSIAVEAVSVAPHIYEGYAAPARAIEAREPPAYGAPAVAFLDLPLIRGDEPPHAGHVAAFSSPWPGGAAFYRSASGTGYALKAEARQPAVMGETLWDFHAGPTSRWDRGNRVQVRVYGGRLASVDDVTLFGGANSAAIGNGEGQWEVIQFATATLVGEGVYELSDFLRGQWGTEGAMRSPVKAGARFVLLDGAVTPVDMAPGDVGVPFLWKFGPAVHDYGHWTYRTMTRAFAGLGLKPLAPCHVKRRRLGNGDEVIAWVRRTRVNGDSWELAEVPLGEEVEAYEVDVMEGASVKRTLAARTPRALYTAAQQAADWGGPAPEALTVRVFQMSAALGRGWGREVVARV